MPQPICRLVRGLAVVAATAALAGCAAHIIGGQALYASDTPSAPAPSVQLPDLPKLIPPLPELAAVVSSPELKNVGTVTRIEAQPEGYALSDSNCLSTMNPGSDSAYRGSRYQGVYGIVAQDEHHRTVDALAVAFSNAAAAESLADSQARKWKECTDKTLTAIVPDMPTSNWMVSGPTRSYGVVVLLRVQEGGQGFACARGIAARANVVADVSVCNPDHADIERQTSKVANMILERIRS